MSTSCAMALTLFLLLGSFSEALTFGEESVLTGGPWASFGLLLQVLVSLNKTSHVLIGIWEMTV